MLVLAPAARQDLAQVQVTLPVLHQQQQAAGLLVARSSHGRGERLHPQVRADQGLHALAAAVGDAELQIRVGRLAIGMLELKAAVGGGHHHVVHAVHVVARLGARRKPPLCDLDALVLDLNGGHRLRTLLAHDAFLLRGQMHWRAG